MSSQVILFSTPQCSWCRTTKNFLKKHKIRFKEIDITRDERASRDMVRRTGQSGVPVILINNRPIVGFDQTKIKKALNLK
jgi:glutaredoxin-like YruB-family protein